MKSEQIDESAPARGQEAINSSTEMQRYAYKGYSDVVGGLKADGQVDLLVEAADQETFDIEFHSWLTDAKLAQMAEARRLDPELRFYLIAVPNILVSPESLRGLAKTFGRGSRMKPTSTGPYSIRTLQKNFLELDQAMAEGFSLVSSRARSSKM